MSTDFLHPHELGLTSLARGYMELARAVRAASTPFASITRWMRNRRTYNELLALNSHTLSDIGLERCDVHLVSGNAAEYQSVDPRRFNL